MVKLSKYAVDESWERPPYKDEEKSLYNEWKNNCPGCGDPNEDCPTGGKCEPHGCENCKQNPCQCDDYCEECGMLKDDGECACNYEDDPEARVQREDDAKWLLEELEKREQEPEKWRYYGYESPEDYERAKKTRGADMSWEKSTVMSEFLKIAEDQNILGAEKVEPNPYQEDQKTIEEKRLKSPEKHIMEVAHPKPVYIAEARGDGALVENEIEHQQKVIDMLNKMPTGSLVGRYASAINQLVKLAEQCDSIDQTKAADLLTSAAGDLLVDLEAVSFLE